MTVIGTGISWTNSTWNLWVGCIQVSSGCTACYAKTLVEQRWKQPFDQVKLHMDRLAHVRRFKPIVEADGKRKPHMVFVNSLSDFFFEQVSDEMIHQALDVMEAAPDTVFQILTKRQIRARKVLVERYKSGIPANIWIGVTAESNDVAARLNVLRSIKERTGGSGTFFASVEPIVGPTDTLNFEGCSWVITGGESGPKARVMERAWLTAAVNAARRADIALWHKQSGQIASHPNLDQAPADLGVTAKFKWLVANGWERLPDERGGATIDKSIYRQLPPHYHELTRRLNDRLI